MRMKMDIELHRSYKKSKINELATYKKSSRRNNRAMQKCGRMSVHFILGIYNI